MRVLQLGMTDNPGGIENFLINLYRAADRKKIQFDFVNIYPGPLCFEDEIRELGGKVFRVPSYYRDPSGYLRETEKIIREGGYKVVHVNMNSAAMLWPLRAAKTAGAKAIIAHAHNASSDRGPVKALMHEINKGRIPKYANKFFACSETAGQWFFSEKIRESKNYSVVYNAVDPLKFRFSAAARKQIRKELDIPENAFVVGHAGRFVRQKNHEYLIDRFAQVLEAEPKAVLLLCGKGPLLDIVHKKCEQAGICRSVRFAGVRPDMEKVYSAMDVFALPSLYEGLPTVGVEAQMNGLFCVFSGAVTREVRAGENARFVELSDTDGFTKAILDARGAERKPADDPRFNVRNTAAQIAELYEKFLKETE